MEDSMSGHSKWHSIKHKKGAVDAKRGKLFTKLIKEITVAARLGGGDLDANPRLRTVVAKNGVAIMIDTLTDNRNRTIAEIRSVLTKSGGNLGENGCVSWIFEKKGVITLSAEKYDENTVMEVALDAGADDIQGDDNVWEVTTTPENYETLRNAFIDRGMELIVSDIMRVPKTTVKLDEKTASKVLSLMERLEDNDDVQNVASNFDIPDEILQGIGE